MIKRITGLFSLLGMLLFHSLSFGGSQCSGHFINPMTDICWSCLFPLSIGDATIVSGENPDTQNPSIPIQACQTGAVVRLGLALGYWEPFATTDVTRNPYCLVNLGGMQPEISYGDVNGSAESPSSGATGAFYQVHWYRYPLIAWLNLITSAGCLQPGDYDVGYLSELDPTWDDELGFLVNPEAILFGNSLSQVACLADSVSAATGSGVNALFWCMGAQGSSYPLSGHISDEFSVLENATLLSERMAYKLHRLGLVKDSNGENGSVCHESYQPIIPKNRYRYELMNPTADAKSCHPFGHTATTWQSGMLRPDDKGNYGYLIWRKRNCVFL